MRKSRNRYAASLFGVLVVISALACSSAAPAPAAQSGAPGAQPVAPISTVAPAPISPATAAPAAPITQQAVDTPAAQTQALGAFIWEIGEVGEGTKPSIALKSDDTPYVAYMLEAMPGFVKNAIRNGSGWDISTIQEGYFYGPLDIAIGPDDVAHITYHDHQENRFQPDKGDAVVAVESGGGWDIETIFDSGHDGWDTRIAVADDGSVHVSAIDPEEFNGRGVEYYVREDGGRWKVESIGSGSLTYKYATSIAVDPKGVPHLAFYDQKSNDLALATRSDSGWVIAAVDEDGDTGLFSSLVIDADGRFHISYFEKKSESAGVVKYATRADADSSWEIREIDVLDRLVFGFVGARNITSIAVDSKGNPWVAYSDEKRVSIAVWDGSDWDIDTVVDAGDRTLGQLVVMKLDSDDEPHLTYFEVTSKGPLNGKVMYARGASR